MNFYENIEKYINGELRGQELAEMETALEKDHRLHAEFVFRKEIDDALSEDDIMNLRDQLQEITLTQTDRSSDPAIAKWITRRKSLLTAASLGLLLGLGGLGYYHLNQPATPGEIFNKYYEPYEATITIRSGNAELNSLLTKAYLKYQEEQYAEAIQLFNQVLNKGEDLSANLYSGISYMEINKYQKAKGSFKSIIKDKDNLLVEHAKWYTAMCHLKMDNITKAQTVLKELSDESQFYKDRSKKVLRKLGNQRED